MITRSISLYMKMFAAMSGILLLVGLVLVVLVNTTVYDKIYESFQKRGSSRAAELADSIANALLTGRHHEIQMRFRDILAADGDIEYLFVRNVGGAIVVHSFEGGFPGDLAEPARAPGRAGNSVEQLSTERGVIIDIAVPIVQGSLGVLHLGMREQPVRQEVREILGQMLLALLLVLIIGNGIALAVASAVTRPVAQLVRATQEAARGNFDIRTDIRGQDEIGTLAAAFNDMLEKRRQSDQALVASEKKFRDITESIGEGLLVIDAGGRLVFMNSEAERLLSVKAEDLLHADLHERVHSVRADGTVRTKDECPNCEVLATGVRQAVEKDLFLCGDGSFLPVSYVTTPLREGERTVGAVIAFQDITLRELIVEEREALIDQLQDALENVKTLKGLIPICASCKSIRDDKGYWSKLEEYMLAHAGAEFSHALCPACAAKLYPKYFRPQGS